MSRKLSSTEQELYEILKEKKKIGLETLRSLVEPNKMGALGKLKSLGLIEFRREYAGVGLGKRRIKFVVVRNE